MIVFKIIGFILMMSPITIQNEFWFFPYSILGIVLVVLSSLLSPYKHFPIMDLVFGFFSILSIIMVKPISYQLYFILFVGYQYLIILLFHHKRGSSFLGILGLLCLFLSIVFPITQVGSLFLLIILLIINQKKQIPRPDSILIIIDDDLFLQETIIPLEETNISEQENEYVIPTESEQK